MTDALMESVQRKYWLTGNLKQVGTGLTGLIAVFLALKLVGHETGAVISVSEHILRMTAYCSLTVWMTLSMGLNRRGVAAIVVLAFASFCELFLLPARGEAMGTLASANLGIVFAYCGLQMYAWCLPSQEKSAEA